MQYIDLQRLEYLITYRCTSRCIHCCAVPQTDHADHIEIEVALRVLEEAAEVGQLQSVMTFGGEPLLYPDVVCAIHDLARRLGIEKRSVITNGFWGKSPRPLAERLAACGVNAVHMSVDAFHQEWLPVASVRHAAQALLESGVNDVSWNPCWLESPNGENPYDEATRGILDELSDLDVRVSDGNVVVPEGRALTNLSEYFECSMPAGKCGDMPYTDPLDHITTLCLDPDGSMDVCPAFHLGSIHDSSLRELVDGYDPHADPDMALMLTKGIEGFLQKARESGIDIAARRSYTLCGLCTALRNDPRWRGRTGDEDGRSVY